VVACAVSAALGFAAAGVGRSWSAGAASPERTPEGSAAVLGVHTTERLVALTLDDGPDPRWTPQVLDLLHRYDATATFFDTGLNAVAHPDLIAAEIAGGHEIGGHTWSHAHLTTLPTAAVEEEIVNGAQAIHGAGAPMPTYFRPPYGESDDAVEVLAAANGYRTVWWNLAVERFVNHTPDIAGGVAKMLSRVHPGSIILAHDGGVPDRARTMQALPLLFDGLKARGYRVVDVSTLLAASPGIRRAPAPAPSVAP